MTDEPMEIPEEDVEEIEEDEEEDEERDVMCSSCNGSGEGYADGTRCHDCKGMGSYTIKRGSEYDGEDEDRERYNEREL